MPATPQNLSTQARNAIAHQENAERDDDIRRLRAAGVLLKDIATQFGISIARVNQIVRQQNK